MSRPPAGTVVHEEQVRLVRSGDLGVTVSGERGEEEEEEEEEVLLIVVVQYA